MSSDKKVCKFDKTDFDAITFEELYIDQLIHNIGHRLIVINHLLKQIILILSGRINPMLKIKLHLFE